MRLIPRLGVLLTTLALASCLGGPGPEAPTITDQPKDKAVFVSQTANFDIGVTGKPPFTFQWYRNGVVVPKNFFHYLQYLSVKIGSGRFAGNDQNDSSELLSFILDTLSDATAREYDATAAALSSEKDSDTVWRKMYQSSYSDIIQQFYGQYRTVIHCSECGKDSINYDPYSILNIPIPDTNRRNHAVSLHDCMVAYQQEEQLTGDNQYYCEHCGKHTNATRTEGILKTAHHLIITLKRFNSNGRKNSTYVDFQPHKTLDMSPYLYENGAHSPCKNYRLYAISNHVGDVGGGHYYSYISRHGKWYEFNDTHVTTVSPDSIPTANAYVLFYEAVAF